MKRMISFFLIAALAVGLPAVSASAENDGLILTATVSTAETLALKAPSSGLLAPFQARVGDVIGEGETIFEVEPVRVYADIDGTVADVYVAEGGVADAAMARYGAVMRIEYADRYEINANAATGYNNAENRDLRVGTPVYLRSSNEGHFADGVITGVNGLQFTVQVLGGDLVYTQDVKIYRESDYGNKSLLARGRLSSVAPYSVSASGTVMEVAVKAGDVVQEGDFLFSYVPDVLSPDDREDATRVKAERGLIMTALNVQQGAGVQKDQVLAYAAPLGEYELTAHAEEGDVHRFAVGDTLIARFEELDIPAVEATVLAISPLGSEGDVSKYEIRMGFEAPEGVWPGMHATVEHRN